MGIVWENTTPSTELPHDFCAEIGPLQLGVVLVLYCFVLLLWIIASMKMCSMNYYMKKHCDYTLMFSYFYFIMYIYSYNCNVHDEYVVSVEVYELYTICVQWPYIGYVFILTSDASLSYSSMSLSFSWLTLRTLQILFAAVSAFWKEKKMVKIKQNIMAKLKQSDTALQIFKFGIEKS